MPVHEGLGTCDLKAPLPGAGGVCQYSRTARAQRECESRFPLQNRREESKRFFPLSFVCRCMRDPAHATSKRPFQGSGVSAEIRGTARAQRECEFRFPLQSKRENLPKVLPLLVLRLQSGCLRPRIFRIPWISRGSSGLVGRKRPDGVFCCRFGRPARRASVGGCCSAQSLLLRRLFRIRACAAPAGG